MKKWLLFLCFISLLGLFAFFWYRSLEIEYYTCFVDQKGNEWTSFSQDLLFQDLASHPGKCKKDEELLQKHYRKTSWVTLS